MWAPGLYFTHECPDLFQIGDWWYLVFSEFSDANVTRYRMSRSPSGPWLAPAIDTFDGRAFYAAKTASDGQRRYLFGWNPTRNHAQNSKPWSWGGNLAIHELHQDTDGALVVTPPTHFEQNWHAAAPIRFATGMGECAIEQDQVTVRAPDSFGCAVAGLLPDRCQLKATVSFDAGTRGFGLMLHTSERLEKGYYIRFEPGRGRLVLDEWPRAGDIPYFVELERPLALPPGKPVQIIVILDGSIYEVYAGSKVAMSARLYDHVGGTWGVFAVEGTAPLITRSYLLGNAFEELTQLGEEPTDRS